MLRALRDEVIVKPIYEDKVGSIIIPEFLRKSKKDAGHGEYRQYHGFVYGVVESVGPRYKNTFQGRQLQKGDKVLWRRHEGQRIYVEGQEFILLKEKWVEAVYEE